MCTETMAIVNSNTEAGVTRRQSMQISNKLPTEHEGNRHQQTRSNPNIKLHKQNND